MEIATERPIGSNGIATQYSYIISIDNNNNNNNNVLVRELRNYKYIASNGCIASIANYALRALGCTEKASTARVSDFLGFLWGDYLWQGGTTYGAVDGPGGPSVAAVLGPGGPSMATKTCRRWSGGTDIGGTIHGMTVLGWFSNGSGVNGQVSIRLKIATRLVRRPGHQIGYCL